MAKQGQGDVRQGALRRSHEESDRAKARVIARDYAIVCLSLSFVGFFAGFAASSHPQATTVVLWGFSILMACLSAGCAAYVTYLRHTS